jgi:adenosylmethionine---8-amino-7-oxononanoate aminotransferase
MDSKSLPKHTLPGMTPRVRHDLERVWHPCTQMKDHETFPPLLIKEGTGIYLVDEAGNRYIDGVSSWWVNIFGHNHPQLNAALINQAERIAHVIFAGFTHDPALDLADKLVERTPAGLERVFFADNGSSAVEVALKMSFQYWLQQNKPNKQRFLSLSDGYHGETIGALSVTKVDLYQKLYQPILLKGFQAESPDCFRCRYSCKRETCKDTPCIESLEHTLEVHHEEIAGFILEPLIQCAAGMKMYPPAYLKNVRELCTQYDVHLIADEIAVGFGRTGTMFACEQANITPDMMCLSKGITGGYMPLSVVLTGNTVYDTFYADYEHLKTFFHSHSYTGNPLACAVANRVMDLFEQENVLENNRLKAMHMHTQLNEYFANHPHVGEIRQQGMVAALELVMDRKENTPFPFEQRIGYQIYQKALEYGAILRPLGNVLYFMPPYVIEPAELDRLLLIARRSMDDILMEY